MQWSRKRAPVLSFVGWAIGVNYARPQNSIQKKSWEAEQGEEVREIKKNKKARLDPVSKLAPYQGAVSAWCMEEKGGWEIGTLADNSPLAPLQQLIRRKREKVPLTVRRFHYETREFLARQYLVIQIIHSWVFIFRQTF